MVDLHPMSSHDLTHAWRYNYFFEKVEVQLITFSNVFTNYIINSVYTNLEGNKSHVVKSAWAMLCLIEEPNYCIG